MTAGSAAELRQVIDVPEQVTPRLRPMTAAEFLALSLPPRELILGPWLPTQGLAMIYSARGIGKTHLALSIAYAVANGGGLLGWSAPVPRKAIYLDGEMPAAAMQRRLAAIIAGVDGEPPEPDYLRLLSGDIIEGGLPDIGTAAGQTEIDGAIGDAELIVIDNISTLVRSGNENEAESWLPVQEWALNHRRGGRSVLFIHHAGKGGLQRGTSRREDVLDTVITLKRPADYIPNQGARFEVVLEKGRGLHGDDARAFEARYEERDGVANWTRTEITDAELNRVADALRNGMSIRETAGELGMHRSKVERLKKKAIEQGKLDD
jgi:putative DNA primase/helicase